MDLRQVSPRGKGIGISVILLILLAALLNLDIGQRGEWTPWGHGKDTTTTINLSSIGYKNSNMTVEFKENGKVIGQATLRSHKSYDEVKKIASGKNRTVIWYEFSRFKSKQVNALMGVEFIDMRKKIFNGSEKEINESEIDEYIISNPDYLLPIAKNYSFVYLAKSGEWVNYDSSNIPKDNVIIGVQTDLFWGERLDVVLNVLGNKLDRHAIVEGTSAGFVTTSPTSDPTGAFTLGINGRTDTGRFTSPATAAKVIEIGFYSGGTSSSADVAVAIYTDDAGNNKPNTLVGSDTGTWNGGSGWIKITGLNIDISENTVYWIAAWGEDVSDSIDIDCDSSAGDEIDYKAGAGLPSPWGTSDGSYNDYIIAIYAVWEAAVVDTTDPTISNEAINDTEIPVDQSIKLNCTVTDNIAVDLVRFYIEPFGNVTATDADPEFYVICNKTNPCNTTIAGQYNWTVVWANDTSDNINTTTVTYNYTVVTTTTSTSTSTTTTTISAVNCHITVNTTWTTDVNCSGLNVTNSSTLTLESMNLLETIRIAIEVGSRIIKDIASNISVG